MKHPMLDIQPLSDELYQVSNLWIERLSQKRIWVFDLEATGLDTSRERITQIAGIPIEGGRIVEEDAFVQFVNPGIDIPPLIQELTGITPDKVANAPSFPEAWARHLEAARGAHFWMGQSVFEFDVPLLEVELARHGMSIALPPILDSVVLATALLGKPEDRWSTSKLLARFCVDTAGLRRHDALDDVKILGRILLPMLRLVEEQHGDTVHVAADKPLAIRRHPPVTSEAPSP